MKRSAVLMGALAAVALPHRARAQAALTKLKVAQPPGTSAALIIYAQNTGIFKKYGLDVELVKMGSGSTIIAALVGGSVDIGSGSTFAVVTAYAHGIPLQILIGGPVYRSNDYGMILVGKNATMKTAADLNGKTFGLSVAKGDLNSVTTQAWIEQHGGDFSTVKVLEVPQDAQIAALDAGRIDALTLQSPNTAIAMSSGKVRQFGRPYDAVGRPFSIACWYGTKAWATANPQALHGFQQAIGEVSRYTNAHWNEILPLMAQFSGVETNVLAEAGKAAFIDRIDPADFQAVIDLEVKYKVIDHSFSAKDFIAPSAIGR
jgi:NitT/TauT family transport system substrate-binding protein